MQTEDRRPGVTKQAFECPHCGAFAQQTHAPLYVDSDEGWVTLGSGMRWAGESTWHEWTVSRCRACGDIVLWHSGVMRYPATASSVAPPRDEMPTAARELYVEAAAVFPYSKRAAAALARASLERLLKDIGAEGRRLDQMLASSRARLGEPTWKLLTALRVVGNTSLHESENANGLIAVYLDDEDADVAEALINAVNLATDALVVAPAEADAIYELIPAEKREAAEREVERASRHATPEPPGDGESA